MNAQNLNAQIEALQNEVFEKQKKLHELRRQAPAEAVQDYELVGADGRNVRLSELFGDKDDLIVIHNMGRSCAYCTLWADGFNGVIDHLEDRAAFVVVSPDSPQIQAEFAASRDWKFRMVSAQDSTFTKDMGYTWEHEGKTLMSPGFSTFKRDQAGTIRRITHAPFGPGDPYSGVWHLFGALEQGVDGWHPKFRYND